MFNLVFGASIVFLCISFSNALDAYKSTLPIEKVSGASGIKLKNGFSFKKTFTNSLTFCTRFNFQRLGNRILEFRDPLTLELLLWIRLEAKFTWFGYGNHLVEGSYSSWLLKDPHSNNYAVWQSNNWHHLCISYNADTTYVNFIKVLHFCKVWLLIYLLNLQFFKGWIRNKHFEPQDQHDCQDPSKLIEHDQCWNVCKGKASYQVLSN